MRKSERRRPDDGRMKNDGTDPKKADDSDPGVEATDRSCFMMIVNQSGQTLTNVSLTHSSGDTNDVINAASMKDNDTTPQKQISFETGPFADFDYWNISFQIGGAAYDTPYNDRCNIAYEDAGQLIQCIVGKHAPWGGDYNLQTKMPKSSSCDFNINKK
jgi:hypothetical protein